jgi:hypothetical protein
MNRYMHEQLTSSIRCFFYTMYIMPKYTSTCMSCILWRKAQFIQSNENDKFGCSIDTFTVQEYVKELSCIETPIK